MPDGIFQLNLHTPIHPAHSGLFVSRGHSIHPDRVIATHELVFVRRGVLDIEEDGQRFEVHPDETLLLFPGRRHRGLSPYPPDLSFYWIHFSLDKSAASSAALTTVPQHTRVNRPDQLTELCRRYIDDQERFGLLDAPGGLLVSLMLWEVGQSSTVALKFDGTPTNLARRADALICGGVSEPLTTARVAAELSCNPSYLSRVYRQTFGLTLTEAIHQYRLRHARRLLLETEDNVEQVARRCGFADAIYFRRIFKRDQGMSPRAYRRLHGRLHINTE